MNLEEKILEKLPKGVKIGTPPTSEAGDISIEFFQVAKERKTSPVNLANENIPLMLELEEIVSAKVMGPYLNLKLSKGIYLDSLLESVNDKSLFNVNLGKGLPALIEHTSINPNASPHIGRARNAIIGDSISRLLRYVGFDLDVHYYVNDMGKQIAMLALACKDLGEVSFDEILDVYVKASDRLKNDESYETKVFEYLKKFEDGDQNVIDEFREIVDKCVKGQSEIFKKMNISYDSYDYESDYVHDAKLNEMVEKLLSDGIAFVDDKDRVVVDLQKIGFNREEGRYSVLKRANGSTMYGYRDIAYHMMKATLSPNEGSNFVVLGEDHKLYFEQLSLILKHFNYPVPEAIHYAFIGLKDGKMSTRQGNVVLLEDFINEVKTKVSERFVDKTYDQEIIDQIAVGAVRFNIIKVKPTSAITFDWDAAISLEGDTCPYIQYTCVRANKIIKDAGDMEIFGASSNVSDQAWELAKALNSFGKQVELAYTQRNPARVAQYLLDVCQKYNSFYGNSRILSCDDKTLKATYVELCKATSTVITEGLSILGIEVPQYM